MRRAGLSKSRMVNARAVISGAYTWGRRHRKVSINPVLGFELPTSTHIPKETVPPELDELLSILATANERDHDLAPVLTLAATIGMRRGELAGLRHDRLRLDKAELLVERAVNDADGKVVFKPTKTHQARLVSLDPATVAFLRQHLAAMATRAVTFGCTVADDGFVFSLEPDCAKPIRPEFMTRRMRVLRKTMGLGPGDFDATIQAMRKWTTTELMDAGFNPSAGSGRQGHTVQVMLEHYSSRRRSADQAAADHLGSRVHQRDE
ncbi:MAG: tyrosine-type recombinase/integrase [Acidimicrobiales bacterium]